MPYWKNYHTPASIEKTLNLLAQYNGQARVVGGGTDLILEMQQGHRPPVEALIDVTRIAGLDRIVEEAGYLVIGAGVTHTQIVSDERIARYGTCLAESCGVIGGPQVRNVATLTGNVAHALPAADGTISLLALAGEAQVASVDGLAWVSLAQIFLGPGQSAVDPSRAFITRLRFKPTGPNEGSAFRRVMRPQGVALPIIGMAVRLKVEANVITSARVTIGPAGPTPFLAEKTMAFLRDKPATFNTYAIAADVALTEANLRASHHRATLEYRAEMIRSQLPKTLAKAAERAITGQAVPEGVGL
ncbi:MAG: FAD binding domain-containing protein [Anaerolineae bacterium]|nr:FAD binding domain-containing protein [Anaerolineae bacterium]